MKNVLVHIGLHKTGTTWLQNELFVSGSENFIPLSTKHPRSGHSTLAAKFLLDEKDDILNSFDDNTEAINQELSMLFRQSEVSDKIYVMSHERLSGYPSSGGFDAAIISRRIKNTFPKAKILVVIREQASCILSNYFQYLKEGGVLDVSSYLQKKYDGRTPSFSENYFKYHYLIDHYQKEFGKSSVLILPFELFSNNKSEFFEILGQFLDISISIKPEKFIVQHNIKTNHYANYKFRFLSKYSNSSSTLNGANGLKFYILKPISLKLKTVLRSLTTSRQDKKLKKQLQLKIEDWSKGRFTVSNQITSNMIGYDLKQYGYK